MRIIGAIVLLCASAGAAAAQLATPLRHTAPPAKQEAMTQAGLELTTSVKEQGYCLADGAPLLILTLRLSFKNTGKVPVLLDRRSSFIDRTMIARGASDAAAGKYESDTFSYFANPLSKYPYVPPEESLFVTIKPGESHDTEADFHLTIDDNSGDSEGELRVGEHFMRVRVGTWYYPFPPDELRQRWRDKGYLWSRNVTSLPMPFEVSAKAARHPCPE